MDSNVSFQQNSIKRIKIGTDDAGEDCREITSDENHALRQDMNRLLFMLGANK